MTSASVTGVVRDTSDAVVPGATVDITNQATNQSAQAVTDARGRFRLLYCRSAPIGSPCS